MPRLRSPESGPKSGGVWRKAWLFVNFFWSKKNIYKDGHFIKIYFLWQLPSPKALNKTVFICCFFKLSKYLQWKSKAKGKAKRLENPLTKVYIVEYWNKEVIPKQARKPRSYASPKLRLTHSLTYSLTGVKCRATSVAKKIVLPDPRRKRMQRLKEIRSIWKRSCQLAHQRRAWSLKTKYTLRIKMIHLRLFDGRSLLGSLILHSTYDLFSVTEIKY